MTGGNKTCSIKQLAISDHNILKGKTIRYYIRNDLYESRNSMLCISDGSEGYPKTLWMIVKLTINHFNVKRNSARVSAELDNLGYLAERDYFVRRGVESLIYDYGECNSE